MDQRVLERALTFAPSIYMASTHTVLVSVRVKHVAICLQNCHTRSGGLWCCYDDEKVGKWKIELFSLFTIARFTLVLFSTSPYCHIRAT